MKWVGMGWNRNLAHSRELKNIQNGQRNRATCLLADTGKRLWKFDLRTLDDLFLLLCFFSFVLEFVEERREGHEMGYAVSCIIFFSGGSEGGREIPQVTEWKIVNIDLT